MKYEENNKIIHKKNGLVTPTQGQAKPTLLRDV